MDGESVQEWRRQRMKALAEQMGGNAALGRRLGYRDGAYVGQMIGGLRPITEKTVGLIDAMPGLAGWFNHDAASVTSLSPIQGGFDLQPGERELLTDFRVLTDDDQQELASEIARRAEKLRTYLQRVSAPATGVSPSNASLQSKTGQTARERARLPTMDTRSEGDKKSSYGTRRERNKRA